jgi:ribonuclease HI
MDRTIVFTDGAAKGNPGPAGWGSVILTPDRQVIELGGGSPHATNNQMELSGVIEALHRLRDKPGHIDVYTDSTYVIRGIREWIRAWKRRGWKTVEGKDVLNRGHWERLDQLVAARGPRAITWHYVRGHTAVPGNERADTIASGFATHGYVELYRGPYSEYSISLTEVPENSSLPERKSTTGGKKSPAYSYLSVVDGRPMRHSTWPECERRVKGKSGARFKKAANAAEEVEILKGWGFSADDL